MTYYAEGEPYGGGNLPPSTPYQERSAGRTRQDDLERSNINNIVSRYHASGELPERDRDAFFYGDVSNMPDYATVFEIVDRARDGFINSLSPELRARFDNDPAKFLDFTNDPANRNEMVELGLLEAPDEITEVAANAGDAARENAAAEPPAPNP